MTIPDDAMAVALAVLVPCPAVTPKQRERGMVCARFANGAECESGGECAEAEGGRWVVTELPPVVGGMWELRRALLDAARQSGLLPVDEVEP